MKIGIINCDRVDANLVGQFGEYPDMFMNTLSELQSSLQFVQFDALSGNLPPLPGDCDGYIITGSRHNSYDNDAWIVALAQWIRSADELRRPVAGICFGHQIIARALGGLVAKSPKGWGLGNTTVQVHGHPGWLEHPQTQLNILVSHQDQVETLPEGLICMAGSDFCPNFMLYKGEHILTVQGHPEFGPAYQQCLLDKHRNDMPADDFQAACQSMDKPRDSAVVLGWILQMFNSAR